MIDSEKQIAYWRDRTADEWEVANELLTLEYTRIYKLFTINGSFFRGYEKAYQQLRSCLAKPATARFW